MIVEPVAGDYVLKLLHFSRAREVSEGAGSDVIVQPQQDSIEFEGMHTYVYNYNYTCNNALAVSLTLEQLQLIVLVRPFLQLHVVE